MPRLKTLYDLRVRFQRVFDTAPDRRTAFRLLAGVWLDILDHFPAMDSFIATFDRWQDAILAYFDAGKTSGPVEGINNKARVIVKRAYGIKSAESLWTRLILDLNRASEVVTYTLDQVQELVAGFRAVFA